jgi:hypothetical protein
MHLFTGSKVALKEAVTRPSERLSPYEVISKTSNGTDWKHVVAAIHRTCQAGRNSVTPPKSGREAVKQTEREMER